MPNLKDLAFQVLSYLQKLYPHPKTNLNADNPWQLLVATILSAQCTDERVNKLTPALFAKWPDPYALAKAKPLELEEVIKPAGFYHHKAKNLLGCAQRVVEVFKGEVPKSLEALITLPGVARKTANCVLWGAYSLNEGIAIDTHVKRISYRLGLTCSQKPEEIEIDLMRLFPQDEWVM
ncbi:MAG: endonuclease III [Desulfovibrionaceae bacterium]|nr:endonuclease III [Desulfovibrionaceae bacterium]